MVITREPVLVVDETFKFLQVFIHLLPFHVLYRVDGDVRMSSKVFHGFNGLLRRSGAPREFEGTGRRGPSIPILSKRRPG